MPKKPITIRSLTLTLTGNDNAPMQITGDLGSMGLQDFLSTVFRYSKDWRSTCEAAIQDSYKHRN